MRHKPLEFQDNFYKCQFRMHQIGDEAESAQLEYEIGDFNSIDEAKFSFYENRHEFFLIGT